MSALTKVVRSGVQRRWVQTTVITLATAAAVCAGLLGVGLLVASNAPFDHAFAVQHGAHLTVLADRSKTTPAQLTASGDAAGVTETAGPFPVAQVMVRPPAPPGAIGTPLHGPVFTVVGRGAPGDGVDAITVTEGTWATGPGEIVIAAGTGWRFPLHSTLTVGEGQGAPTATVVGVARSVSDTADAWMAPAALAALKPRTTGYQMLYRLTGADSAAQVTAARDAVTEALPAGAVTGSRSWLTVKQEATGRTAVFVPFLLGFGGLSLVLSVLIVGTIIAGAVGSTLRRMASSCRPASRPRRSSARTSPRR